MEKHDDDFFIQNLRDGNTDNYLKLIEKYKAYGKNLSRFLFHTGYFPGLTVEDFESVCLECLFIAIKKYTPGKNTFRSYWETISRREISRLVKDNYKYYGHVSVCLDAPISAKDNMFFSEVIGSKECVIDSVNGHELASLISEEDSDIFTEEEKTLIEYRIKGFTAKECAALMNCTEKHVRYLLNRIKKRLAKTYN